MKFCIMKPGPPAFCLVILEYLFPSPLFKCHLFAWELFEHRTWQSNTAPGSVNSPEDGPGGPKHVEIRHYMNKIEIVTSVGFYSIC